MSVFVYHEVFNDEKNLFDRLKEEGVIHPGEIYSTAEKEYVKYDNVFDYRKCDKETLRELDERTKKRNDALWERLLDDNTLSDMERGFKFEESQKIDKHLLPVSRSKRGGVAWILKYNIDELPTIAIGRKYADELLEYYAEIEGETVCHVKYKNDKDVENLMEKENPLEQKEKVSGVELVGWEEDVLLRLNNDGGFNYQMERQMLTTPECSATVVDLDMKYEESFRFVNSENVLGEIVKAVQDINSHASECYVKNGLHAKAPFNIAEEYTVNGEKDVSVMTMYPTEVNGLFVAMQTSKFRMNDNVLSICCIDGNKLAEMANNGIYKTKTVEKVKVVGNKIKKTEVKPISLTPDFKEKSQTLKK